MKILIVMIIIVIIIALLLLPKRKGETTEKYVPEVAQEPLHGSSKTYLTMTTVPDRIRTSWFYDNLVKNITAASKNNFTIILNIPKISGKTKKPYFIPGNIKQLAELPHFIINYTEKDEGPITKLLPTLRNPLVKPNDIIIVCDDDVVYKPNVFEMIHSSVKRHPKSISAMCNAKIEGFKTFGFKKIRLKPLLSMSIPTSCFRIDDDVIQFFIDTRGIPVVSVPYFSDKGWDCSIHFEESENHPRWEELKNDDRKPMQTRCLNELKRKQA